MENIRGLLSEGQSSGEVIVLGFKASTARRRGNYGKAG